MYALSKGVDEFIAMRPGRQWGSNMPDTIAARALPVFEADKITQQEFIDAMNTYSVIHLKNAISPEKIKLAREVVVNTYEEYDRLAPRMIAGEDVRHELIYLSQNVNAQNHGIQFFDVFRSYGSILLACTTMASGLVADILEELVVMPHLTAYFGARPMLALNAGSVRMADVTSEKPCLFHQDGTFLGGPTARTVNTWIALDDCGVDAPGIEVIPYRTDELLPAGKNVDMDWEILDEQVYSRFGGRSAGWAPEFKAGDILAFDHMNIHRTHMVKGMTRNRFALECWMYPPEKRYEDLLLAAI